MQRTIAMSLLAHVVLIVAWVAVSRLGFPNHAGSEAITIHEVMLGDGEASGGSSAAPHSPPLKVRGGGGSYATRAVDSSQASHPITEKEADTGPGTNANGTDNSASTGTVDGNGNGAGTGSGGGSGNSVLAEIRRRIESAKRYPAQARAMHQEGRVGLRFQIHPNGQIADVQITQSSGIPALDDAAIQAVTRSAPLPYYAGAIAFPLNFHLK